MNQLSERYLEDFAVGQTFGSGRLRIEGERALAFAAEFDPQPFHLDEAAARRSIFGGLTASGWHTAAVTMRLLVETELKPAGGLIGAGLDECRWPRPVRPGDELRVECEVIEVRPSKSRPAQGLIKLRTTTLNQHDEAVLVYVVNMVVQRRTEAGEALRHLTEDRLSGKVVLAGDAQRPLSLQKPNLRTTKAGPQGDSLSKPIQLAAPRRR
jgi:acyl dehydratase